MHQIPICGPSGVVTDPLDDTFITRRSEGDIMSEKQDKSGSRNKMGLGIAVGAGVGVALGVAMDELTLWIAIGIGIGIALGVLWSQSGR